jgi:hypothetical protein
MSAKLHISCEYLIGASSTLLVLLNDFAGGFKPGSKCLNTEKLPSASVRQSYQPRFMPSFSTFSTLIVFPHRFRAFPYLNPCVHRFGERDRSRNVHISLVSKCYDVWIHALDAHNHVGAIPTLRSASTRVLSFPCSGIILVLPMLFASNSFLYCPKLTYYMSIPLNKTYPP